MTPEYGLGLTILPIYIVCDESESMGPSGGINLVNDALPELHMRIMSDPLVSARCRISLITFSDSAEELMSLTNLDDVLAMPGVQPRGLANYGSVFDLLKSVISRDIENLRERGCRVYRPAVIFITVGEPTDVATWESSYRSLVDKNTNRHAPNIFAFGMDGADVSVIGSIGSLGAFVCNDRLVAAEGFAKFVGTLAENVYAPELFIRASGDYLPGWASAGLTH